MYVCMYVCMYAFMYVNMGMQFFSCARPNVRTRVTLRDVTASEDRCSLLPLPAYERPSTECYQPGSAREPTLLHTFVVLPAEERRKPLQELCTTSVRASVHRLLMFAVDQAVSHSPPPSINRVCTSNTYCARLLTSLLIVILGHMATPRARAHA